MYPVSLRFKENLILKKIFEQFTLSTCYDIGIYHYHTDLLARLPRVGVPTSVFNKVLKLVPTCLHQKCLHIFLTLKHESPQVIGRNVIFNIFCTSTVLHIDLIKKGNEQVI